jgi:hypothetical protein
MSVSFRLLGISGSLRADSFSSILKALAEATARKHISISPIWARFPTTTRTWSVLWNLGSATVIATAYREFAPENRSEGFQLVLQPF